MRQRSRASSAYDTLVRIYMGGELAELTEALERPVPGMRASELAELRSAIDYSRGQLLDGAPPGLFAVLAWRLWVDLPLGRALVLFLLETAALVVKALGLSDRVYEALRVRLAPRVVHFRYTDFLQGLVYSAILHAFAPRAARTLRSYYEGLIGMFECLSGRLDLGLESLRGGYESLRAE